MIREFVLSAVLLEGLVRTAAETNMAADRDWLAFQAASEARRSHAAEASLKDGLIWIENHSLKVRDLGLAFIEQHPTVPRRWSIVLGFDLDYPSFVKAWGPLDAAGKPTNAVVDEAAVGAWKVKVAELRAAMAKATDLTEEDRASLAAKEVEEAQKPIELSFTALDGRPVDLAALRGKVVLLDFWATWCGPCVEEIPNLKRVYEKYRPHGFEVMGITQEDAGLDPKDTPEERASKLKDARGNLERFVAKQQLPWPQYFDGQAWENELRTKFAVSAIPTMYLLDQAGRIVTSDAHGEVLEKEVRRLLKF